MAEHDSPVKALVWDPRTATVFVGHADGVLRTATRSEGSWQVRLIGIHHDGVRALTLGSDGQLFSAGVDGTVTRWKADLLAGAVTRRVSEFGQVCAIDWLSPYLVVGAQDGTVQLRHAQTLEEILSADLGSSVLAISGHGKSAFAGLANGEVVALPNFGLGLEVVQEQRMRLHNSEIRGIEVFELSGNLVVATTGLDRRLVVADMRTSSVLADIALDGFGLGLHVDPPFIAVSTTSGAMIVEVSSELPGFVSNARSLERRA